MKERHLEGRRRARFDRRSGKERRRAKGSLIPGKERRKGQRRSGVDRRAPQSNP